MDVQSADSSVALYYIHIYTFIFEVLFWTTFCSSFWKRVHSSKQIVKIEGLFVLAVIYLSVHFHACCLYIQYRGGIREITSMSVSIFCFICVMLFILSTRCKNIRLFYTTFALTMQERSRFEPAPQSTICSYAPVIPLTEF